MLGVLEFAQALAGAALERGNTAVDATAGNGHDTLFLARQVGAAGHVYGFDVQQEALASTKRRLQEGGVLERVELIQAGHECMGRCVPEEDGKPRAVMFNLGYLPGGDKTCITRPGTTLAALDAAIALLAEGGILTVVLYTGHAGGREEAQAVTAWAKERPQQAYQVLSYRFLNRKNDPPRLIAVEKRSQ